jgi:TolB-like protein
MASSGGGAVSSGGGKTSAFKDILQKLRKRRIVETLAAFIGGGWLLVEVVERLLVEHYGFPNQTIDLTVVSVIGALLATLVWRWFRSADKGLGNVKVEILLVPLIILATVAIDLNIIFRITGISFHTLLIGGIAFLLGIAWVILKLSQWASAVPASGTKEAGASFPTSVRPEKSIVVLPFTDLSPQKDQEYFCDGMTEEIITDLSHVHDLLVISRSSAMTFKDTKKTIPEIAQSVNVRYVLEGSVRKAGSGLRIVAQLIDAPTDTHLWADKYAGTLDDVFDIQEKVSRSIVGALKLRLAPDEERRIADRPLANVNAYDAYLRARQDIWRWTKPALERAQRHLQNALDIVGDNALLFAGLGSVYVAYVHAGIQMDEGMLLKAEEFAEKGARLEPDLAQCHSLLASIAMARGQMKSSFRHAQRALAISPADPDALFWLLATSFPLGKTQFSAPYAERFVQIDPLSYLPHMCLGLVAWNIGRLGELLDHFRTGYRLDPESYLSRWWFAGGLLANGLFQEAEALIQPWTKEAPGQAMSMSSAYLLNALRSEKELALNCVTNDWKGVAWQDYWLPYTMAEGYALIGETAEALRWLENAIDKGWINYPFLAENDPWLAGIRDEPGFKKLMERVEYEWEHFEV